MPPRLLIINAPSPYFFYIPMGTFGLCDYLAQRGVVSCIFNPALYPETLSERLLLKELDTFAPTHVAIVFHWQETAEGMMRSARLVKAWNPDIPILVGGFTASYFGADLMRNCLDIDYLLHGDPEEPLGNLLTNKPLDSVANLTYRRQGQILTSPDKWLISPEILNRLSYARLDFLHDSQRYIEKINTKLGFPIFLGRGCIFNCQYCGGSRHAFTSHSHRNTPATRSIASVIADLHLLKEHTDTLYLCYENKTDQIVSLFKAIGDDPQLRGHFTLHYGAWHLPDQEFMSAYSTAFRLGSPSPIFEFSPEVISDSSRKSIKGSASYDLLPLLESCRTLSSSLKHRVRIELFFSRYHPTENSFSLLLEELKKIYLLKHDLYKQGARTIRVCYDHLSTDVASRYWSDLLGGNPNFADFLQAKEDIDQHTRHPFPVDNLCFYIPEELSDDDLVLIEALAHTLEHLERFGHELFHVFCTLTAVEWIDVLAGIIPRHLDGDPASFFLLTPHGPLLQDLVTELIDLKQDNSLTFLKDLVSFTVHKRLSSSEAGRTDPPTDHQPYRLDKNRYTIHHHDYLDVDRFLSRLSSMDNRQLSYERTVYLYLDQEIIALPHRTYRNTYAFFESSGSIEDFKQYLEQKATPGPATHRFLGLLHELIENRVLIPDAQDR